MQFCVWGSEHDGWTQTESIGGSRGGVRDARPPWASKFFRFHAVFGKIWRVHAPPGGFTPPPRENPGSATGEGTI